MYTRSLTLLSILSLVAAGCLDDAGGSRDQYYNTDAYVSPEAGVSDGGVSCGDELNFGAATQLSQDVTLDGGQAHSQSDVTMDVDTSGTRYVAWVDRNLALSGLGDVRVAPLPAGATAASSLLVDRPADCDTLVEPTVAVAADGTVLVAGTCLMGTEDFPLQSQIVLYRSVDGAATFDAPQVMATCDSITTHCNAPALVALPDGPVYLAWTRWYLEEELLTEARIGVVRSDDSGVTFGGEVPVQQGFALAVWPRLAAGTGGTLHIAYSGALTVEGTEYAVYTALDGNGGLGAAEILGPGIVPGIGAGGGLVYVAWVASNGVIQEAHGAAGGIFTPPAAVTDETNLYSVMPPRVAVGPDDVVHLFWLAEGETGWRAFYTGSDDEGETWRAPLVIAGPFDGDPTGAFNPQHRIGEGTMVVDDRGVTLGWADPRTTELDVGVTHVFVAHQACP